MEEVFKDIDGFGGSYKISNYGRVLSAKQKKKLLSPRKCGLYIAVCLYDSEGVRKNYYIHILVANHFIPNPNNLPEVNHKDGDKSNCYEWNLEWCTHSGNMLHAYRTGLKTPPCAQLGKSGSQHHRSKKVYQYNLDGTYVSEFVSVCEASRESNLDRKSISMCANNERKSFGGFIWSFDDDWNNV